MHDGTAAVQLKDSRGFTDIQTHFIQTEQLCRGVHQQITTYKRDTRNIHSYTHTLLKNCRVFSLSLLVVEAFSPPVPQFLSFNNLRISCYPSIDTSFTSCSLESASIPFAGSFLTSFQRPFIRFSLATAARSSALLTRGRFLASLVQ